MKRDRFFAVLLFAAAMALFASSVFAAGTKTEVSAIKNTGARISFDGTVKAIPADMTVLFYQDRVYTPARFIAESLGADVGWDEKTETVLIKTPEPTPTPAPSQAPSPSPTPSPAPVNYAYQTLPLRLIKNELTINIYGQEVSKNYLRLYLDFVYRGALVNLDYTSVKDSYITLNGEKIPMLAELGGLLEDGATYDTQLVFEGNFSSGDVFTLTFKLTGEDVLDSGWVSMDTPFHIDLGGKTFTP